MNCDEDAAATTLVNKMNELNILNVKDMDIAAHIAKLKEELRNNCAHTCAETF